MAKNKKKKASAFETEILRYMVYGITCGVIFSAIFTVIEQPDFYQYPYSFFFTMVFYLMMTSVLFMDMIFLKLVEEEQISLELAKKAFLDKSYIPNSVKQCRIGRHDTEIENLFAAEASNFYHIVYGVHGIGKSDYLSTRAREIPHAIYYSLEHNDNLPDNLFSIIFEREKSMVLKIFDLSKDIIVKFKKLKSTGKNINFMFKFFAEYREYFKNFFGTTPIIIIDNINLFDSIDGKIGDSLENILHNSKTSVDSNSLKLILVASEGSLPKIIPQSSTSSRLKTHFIHEIDKESAIDYLKCCLKDKKHQISNFDETQSYEEIYQNIGGHLLYLVDFCDSYHINSINTVSDILGILAEDRYVDFVQSGVNLKTITFDPDILTLEEYKTIIEYIIELSKSDNIFLDYAQTIKKIKKKLPSKVLTKNIFRITIIDAIEYISFESLLHKRKVKDILGETNEERVQTVNYGLNVLYSSHIQQQTEE